MFLDSVPECSVQTDASFEAAGAFFHGDWRYFNFVAESDLLADLHINYKEVLAVLMAAENWSNQWCNRHVIIHSDNQVADSISNKGSTKTPIFMHYLRKIFWFSAVFNFCITAKYTEGAKNVIADAISRLHSFPYLFRALGFLADTMSFGLCYKPVCSIICLSIVHCFFPLGSLASALEQEITSEVFEFRSHTLADTTKRSYRTYQDSFLRFCLFMGFTPLPADTRTICLYAAFLARSLQFCSINNYLGIIALLHKEFNLPNQLSDNWVLKSLLAGIKRVKGNTLKQKRPITSHILAGIHRVINLCTGYDSSFWAVCLIAFFWTIQEI